MVNADRIYGLIEDAAVKAGRRPQDILLCAVTKKQPVDRVLEYIAYCKRHGLRAVLGENYVQEYREKKQLLPEGIEVHLIGHLQSNKVSDAVQIFDCVQSVDSEKLVTKLSTTALRIGKRMPVLVQVNISDDSAKSGASLGEVERLCEVCMNLDGVELKGLMTITELYPKPELARKDFAAMRIFKEKIVRTLGLAQCALSMGMSDDFTYAIEEGADIVRVGSALFGARS